MTFEKNENFAVEMDNKDKLHSLRHEFLFPQTKKGGNALYFAGNSLGLQPKRVREYIDQELQDWELLGVEGHFHAKHPWLPYHENVTESLARVVGALPSEVVAMNSLSVNLHLMMTSFYRPTRERFKILIEGGAFPSDQYAVASQARFHGFDPKSAVVELRPRSGEDLLRQEDILSTIEKQGSEIALILLGNVNYLTGQAFDIPAITQAGHKRGCVVGFDLAHGAGNLLLKLHDWNVDFAVWCSYKYLNAGPGAIGGCFVHERHDSYDGPRFEGWWGHNKKTRFQMKSTFEPIKGAEAWQLSNPPIFQLAALRASLELFDRATMVEIRRKSDQLTSYLEYLLKNLLGDFCQIVTPKEVLQRGSQLSLRLKGDPRGALKRLQEKGVICDFREPDIMRVAPTALYNSFLDVFQFAEILGGTTDVER